MVHEFCIFKVFNHYIFLIASIRIESVNFSDGDKVIRGDNEHVGTVRSGMIYETSSPNTRNFEK